MKRNKARSYADKARGTSGRVLWALPYIIAAIFFLGRCGGEPRDAFSNRARLMLLTSNRTEIVLFSSKIPGYWAKQVSDEEEFFLSTQIRSYEKGCYVRVEGPFGNAFAAVFRDETGDYISEYPTNILVVWKMAENKIQKDAQPTSKKDNR